MMTDQSSNIYISNHCNTNIIYRGLLELYTIFILIRIIQNIYIILMSFKQYPITPKKSYQCYQGHTYNVNHC